MTDITGLGITQEEINKYLTQLVVDSGLGDFFKSKFKEVVEKALVGWDNSVEKFIQHTVNDYVTKELEKSHYQEMIMNKLRKDVTQDVISKIIEKGMHEFKLSIKKDDY